MVSSVQMLANRLAAAGLVNAADSGYGRKSAAPPRNLKKGGAPRRTDSDTDSDFD